MSDHQPSGKQPQIGKGFGNAGARFAPGQKARDARGTLRRVALLYKDQKAALAVMPLIRVRIALLLTDRANAARAAQQKAAEAQYQTCLEKRSSLQKLAGMARLDDSCTAPK